MNHKRAVVLLGSGLYRTNGGDMEEVVYVGSGLVLGLFFGTQWANHCWRDWIKRHYG
jgi:hypothetical protein